MEQNKSKKLKRNTKIIPQSQKLQAQKNVEKMKVGRLKQKLASTNFMAKLVKAAKNKDKPANEATETPYYSALLHPELAKSAKIPGSAVASIGIHRKQVIRQTVNANGCFHVVFQPENALCDNSTNYTAIFYTADATYTGLTAISNTLYSRLAISNPYNLPVGTGRTYRCVSASITVRSLASALNRTGDIHVGFCNGQVTSMSDTVPRYDQTVFGALSNIDNFVGGKYALAHVEKGMCGRGVWIPQDVTCLDFKAIGQGVESFDNFISIIGIGLAASSSIEIEANYNYEITPNVGSVLYGMETICKHSQDPLKTWRQVYQNSKVASAVYDTSCSLPSNVVSPTQPISEIDRLVNMYMNGKQTGFTR